MLNKFWRVKGKEIKSVADVKAATDGVILETDFSSCTYNRSLLLRDTDEETLERLNKGKETYKVFALKIIDRPVIFSAEIDEIINNAIVESDLDSEEWSLNETQMDKLLKVLSEKLNITMKEV